MAPHLVHQPQNSVLSKDKETFLSVLDRILQGYLDQNLRIQDFYVSILLDDHESVSVLEKWIPIIILSMGVKKFSLNLDSKSWAYYLPSGVFETESALQDLNLERCNLKLKGGREKKLLLFKHLKRLVLSHVHIDDEETIHNIISNCLLIEDKRLDKCKGLRTMKIMNKKALCNLKNFAFSGCFYRGEDDFSIEIDVPTLEFFSISNSAYWFHDHKFPNLKSLNLRGVRLPSKLFSDSNFLCYFPVLENLNIIFCYGLEELQLSNYSIMCFRYTGHKNEPVKLDIDAPHVRYFQFSDYPSFISFKTTYSEWESNIILYTYLVDSDEWFRKLNEMLKALSQSKISLSITHIGKQDHPLVLQDHTNGDGFMNTHLLVMERFTLRNCYSSSVSAAILNGLFRICRPRNIYYYSISPSCDKLREHKEVTEFLCNMFMLRGNNNGELLRNHHEYYWQEDLKVVSLEISDRPGGKWHSAEIYGTTSNLSKCAAYPDNKSIRFRIKWRNHLF